jgi:hypothetical protein
MLTVFSSLRRSERSFDPDLRMSIPFFIFAFGDPYTFRIC